MLNLVPILRKAWPYIIVAIVILILYLYLQSWGDRKYEAGRESYRAEVEETNRRLAEAMQLENDRAQANYRGAVLARQAAEANLVDRDKRIASLLNQLRTKHTPVANTSDGIDGAGADWIGIFGACYGEYVELGKDAARLADKVNGLQGYIRAVHTPVADY